MRRHAIIILVLILIGAAVNVPIAVQFIKSRTAPRAVHGDPLRGAPAAAHGWPTRTPHDHPWPAPDYRQIDRWFGARRIDIRGLRIDADGTRTATPAMQFELYGWPLPCLERAQMWWDWNDPAWQITAEPDPAMRLHWSGIVLNPLIFAGAAWLLLIAPVVAFRALRRRIRHAYDRCANCGYPRGTSPVCTECGTPLRPIDAAPADAPIQRAPGPKA